MLKKLLKSSLGMAFLLLCSMSAYAQTGTVTGTIMDSQSSAPLPGANVYITELERGSSTNADGVYTISSVPTGTYTLRISYVGYETMTQSVSVESGENVIDFQLQPSAVGMDEVVVTALGLERESRSIGYAMQEVESESITQSQETNLVNALSGKVAGVQISSSSGQPGSSSRITIRGNSSMLGDNQPLFVVDGIPISSASDDNPYGSALFTGGTANRALDLDPSIIEDISVLKGASATALYGSRAANGAIIISTKSGSEGRQPTVSFNSSVGWSSPILDGLNDEYLGGTQGYYHNGKAPGEGGYAEPGSPSSSPFTITSWGPHRDSVSSTVLNDLGVDQIPTYNPREQFYRMGVRMANSLNISGGTETSTYFFSANNTDQGGIVPNSSLDKTSLTGKFSSDLSEELSVQTSVNYINTSNKWFSEGNGTQNYLYALNFTPINYDLEPYQNDDGSQRMHHPAINNPNWLVENNGFTSDVNRFIASSEISLDILPWLTITERLGIDTYGDKRKGRTNTDTRGSTSGMFDQKITRTQINSDLTVSAERNLTENLNLDLTVGNNINSRNYNYEYVEGTELNIPGFFHVSNANSSSSDEEVERVRLVSVYGQATLGYNEYLYLTLTGRNDWSSTLPDANNSYFYPSASLGFIFTDAFETLQESSVFSFGKLRASIAQIGNDAPAYSLSTNYTQAAPGDGVRGVIDYPFNGVNGYQLDNVLGNPALKPEISTEYEIGGDFRFFDSRIRLDMAYYDRTTRNQIFQVPVSDATGFSDQLGNAGEIRNYGLEATLGITPIQTQDFSWTLDANFAKSTTEVVELAPGVENIFLAGFTGRQIRIESGEKGYGVIYGPQYARFQDGPHEGELKIGDDGLPQRAAEPGVIGNVQPDWTGSLRTTFNYKGIELSGLIDVSQGGDIFNMDMFYTSYYGTAEVTEKRGTEYVYDGINVNTGEPNTTPITRDQEYYQNHFSSVDENFVEDGSYIKLRELSLGYTLPRSLTSELPIRSLAIRGIARNLWIKTDFSYGDPEGNLMGDSNAQGFYHMVTPSTRSFNVSLNVSF